MTRSRDKSGDTTGATDSLTRDTLLDTGPIVAALDAGDQWHHACRGLWPDAADRCITTEAVVTEACHLVLRGGGPAVLPLQFLLSARIPIVGLDSGGHRHAAQLMDRYADLPMDYADAALVTLADVLHVERILTTDRRGFKAYRGAHGRKFDILP